MGMMKILTFVSNQHATVEFPFSVICLLAYCSSSLHPKLWPLLDYCLCAQVYSLGLAYLIHAELLTAHFKIPCFGKVVLFVGSPFHLQV